MKKSTKFLAFAALLACILINYGCPAIFGYNIVGSWNVTAAFDFDSYTEDYVMTFAGDRKTGTVTWEAFGYTLDGTYAVDGKNVDFDVSDAYEIQTFTGTFSNKDEMSGTGVWLVYGDAPADLNRIMRRQARAAAASESYSFTWTAARR